MSDLNDSITDIYAQLVNKSDVGHTHIIADIVGLQDILNDLVTYEDFNNSIAAINNAISSINLQILNINNTLIDHQQQITDLVNAEHGAGGQTAFFTWKFDTSIVASDPLAGNFRANSASASGTTQLYIDDITSTSGIDVSQLFNAVHGEWFIHIQQRNDATKWAQFNSSTDFIDNGGWWTIDVDWVATGSGGEIDNNRECLFVFVNKNSADNLFIDDVVDGDLEHAPTSNAVWDELSVIHSTGILWGGALTVNVDPTKFNIAAGEGYIVNNTDLSNVIRTKVIWNALTGNTVTNIGTQLVTYVFLNANGTIHQSATFPNETERRQRIFLGRLNHSNLTTITFTDTFPDLLHNPIAQYFDLTNAIGAFSYNGNIISANGANLSINKTNGKMFNASFNYITNNQSPNNIDLAGITLASFRHQNQNSTDGSNITVIDPTNYDVGGVTTTVPNPGATATAMRVYLFPSNTIRIQRGQAVYGSLSEAIAGYKGEVFTENPANTGVAVWIATICVQKNCTDLTDTTRSRIIIEPKFGGSAGAAGVTTATLQSAYNNSTVPQIITDITRGGITVRRGSASDSDNIFVGQNGSGVITSYIKGNGDSSWIAKNDGATYDTNAIMTLTAAEYAAIVTKDPSTLYFII